MSDETTASSVRSRRRFLRDAALIGAAGLTAAAMPEATEARRAVAASRSEELPIDHVIIACQENRSFDHYYGYYPNADSFGVPPGFTVPDGHGGTVAPSHLTSHSTKDIAHEWAPIHAEWDQGRMDGFYTTDGSLSLGYYDRSDLGYYYALADHFTLCANYFCSLLGPTFPNRLYLWSGTSGGNTSNKIAPGSLHWPTITDLLDAHGITWKCYNLGLGAVLAEFNALMFFSRWYRDPRLYRPASELYADLRNGTLPQVSWLIPSVFTCEHPPASIEWGQGEMALIISALMLSRVWTRSAFFLTYDEGGGFFDHVRPPQFDAYGAGLRVPTLVVSPYARRGYVASAQYEHSSILRFLETRFKLPTLASINHQFDQRTPAQNNDAAGGNAFGPPAPPRDGRADIGDMTEVFDVDQDPNYRPQLPAVPTPPRQKVGARRLRAAIRR